MYLIRLDDACEYMDNEKWNKMEEILDEYGIKPIVGVIPNCKDPKILNKYKKESGFWTKVKRWEDKGWSIALHGYDHCYITRSAGINPIHNRSEFAGVSIEIQKQKIRDGLHIFEANNLYPDIFFAPGHTFDENTIEALKQESSIRIISDTIASKVYVKNDIAYIPQQSGKCRWLPVKIATFCQHPNIMEEKDFEILEAFFKRNYSKFGTVKDCLAFKGNLNFYDIVLKNMYYSIKKVLHKD